MPTSSYTFKILLDGKDAVSAAKQIRAQLEKELGQGFDFRQAKQQMADMADLSQTTGAQVLAMGQGFKTATGESSQLVVDLREADDQTRQMVSDLFRAGASGRELEQALRGGGQAVGEARREVRGLGTDLRSAIAQARRETADLRTLAYAGGRLGVGLMTTGAAIIGPLTLAGRSYLEFADDANRAARQLKLNADLTEELQDRTLDLSASLGLFKPEEISQGLYTWASSLGAVAESSADLNRLLEDSVEVQKLAAMNAENLGSTTEYVAAIMGEFGLDTSQTKRVVELLNFTADRTAATVGDLGQSLKFVGPIAHALGEDIEDVAAILGVAADAGIKQSMAGRAVRQMYVSLTKPTKEMNKAFNEALGLSEELGESWQDIVWQGGKFLGTAKLIGLLAAATEDMTEQQRMALLAHLATANELPTLTALVLDQIRAREQGISTLRAWKKLAEGTVDAEVQKYVEWRQATEGITVSLESATEAWAREWLQYEEEDTARADRLAQRWSTAWIRVGKAVIEGSLPALETLADELEKISDFVEEHPGVVDVALKAGGILIGTGALIKTAATALKLYADAKVLLAAAGGLKGLGGLLTPVAGYGLAAYGGLEVGTEVVSRIRGETVTIRDALEEIWDYTRKSGAVIAGTGGMLTAWLLGEDPAEGFEIATYEAGKLFGLIEEDMEPAAEEVTAEMLRWERAMKESRGEAQALGDDLMELPAAAATGLAVFSEMQLQVLDEWEEHQRSRAEMVERQNEALIEMEEDFLEREEELHQQYLQRRGKLEGELRQVTEPPLWEMSREAQRAREREAQAIDDYNKAVAKAIADHQKRLRDLREDHESRMEDLIARRDAKGIIAERRQYRRSVRNANEQKDELIQTQKDRLEETLERERENLERIRKERKEDLEARLRELDENYQNEAQKRKEAFDKRYADKQQQNAKELTQLEEAYARRLAKITGWEDDIRLELRQKYIGREQDLRRHLQEMEAMYRQMYNLARLPAPIPPGITSPGEYAGQRPGLQAGGYAYGGVYRLGELGREYVLSSSTTRAMERAMGYLTQSKIRGLTGGSAAQVDVSGHIHVTADPRFTPEFIREIEVGVQREVVRLATQTAKSKPGAYRPH